FDTLRSDSIFCPIHIRGSMGRLHGRDDLKILELIEITRCYDLRMFNPPTSFLAVFQVFSIGVQDYPVGRIPNSMGIYLEIAVGQSFDDLIEFFRALQ